VNEFGETAVKMLIKSVGVCLVESDARMKRQEKNWWKLREASILALSVILSELLEKSRIFRYNFFTRISCSI
jgi:hypothetical protein